MTLIWQLTQDVPAGTGFLYNTATMFKDMIKGMHFTVIVKHYVNYKLFK
jgi:hypothetical protein